LGKRFDVKDVAEGHALNLLIPRGLAVVATAPAIAKINAEKEKARAEEKIQEELLAKNIEMIKSIKVTLKGKANEKGHLFAGITKEMLADEVTKSARVNLDVDFIKLDKPLKEVGEHKIKVEALGKKAEFTVVVEAE